MNNRVYNFNPGPSTLPLSVLEKAKSELLNYKGTGMSIMEISHRSKEFESIIQNAESLIKELAGVGDNYRVLFIQGGASMQFDMIPMNFLTEGKTADYIITGSFAEKAYKEAKKMGHVNVAATTKEETFRRIPRPDEIKLTSNAAFAHITTNNTIFGTQWHYIPDTGNIPLIADMSSDILSRPLDMNKFGMVYAGAQKNLGPSGVAVVLIRQDLLDNAALNLPDMLNYNIYAKNDSLYNTPPTFGIYMIGLVLEWINEAGGLSAIEQHNTEKAGYIYEAIDTGDFYTGHADKDSRSLMNITFRLPNEDLDKKFLHEASARNLTGLKGHRSVGGMRVSAYNAMSKQGCLTLAEFMDDFRKNNA